MSEPRRFRPPSELDELRREVALLRRQADDNSDEITKLKAAIRKEAPSE